MESDEPLTVFEANGKLSFFPDKFWCHQWDSVFFFSD